MNTPTLGSAAGMLLVALIYTVWSPAPGGERRVARGTAATAQVVRIAGSPAAITHSQVEASAAREAFLQDLDASALCEIPSGRAALHWMVYLELRQAAGARAQNGQAVQ